MTRVCATCRRRKVRCDGTEPICGPCRKSNSNSTIPCNFSLPSKPPSTSADVLRKGDACIPCRKKKKKCNGARPICNTCLTSKEAYGCAFDDGTVQDVTAALLTENLALQARLQAYEQGAFPAVPFEIGGLQTPSSYSPSQSTYEPTWDQFMLSNDPASQHYSSPDWGSETSERFSPLLPLLATESEGSPGDISYDKHSKNLPDSSFSSMPQKDLEALRLLFLEHAVQLGLDLQQDQSDALCRGDLSGTLIQPALVHLGHLLGCAFSHEDRSIVCPDEAHFQQDVIESLGHPSSPSPENFIQSRCLLAIYLFLKGEKNSGRSFLSRAASIVKFNDDASGCLTLDLQSCEPSNGAGGEKNRALYQLLYIDHSSQMVLGLPQCLEFGVAAKLRERIIKGKIKAENLVMARAFSVILLFESQALVSRNAVPVDDSLVDQAFYLLRLISSHLAEVKVSICRMASSLTGTRHRILALKVCVIMALAAMSKIYRLLGSDSSESRRHCMDTVMETVSVSQSFQEEDYDYLCPVLYPCLTEARNTIRVEQSRLSPTPSIHARNLHELSAALDASIVSLQRLIPE